MDFRTSSGAPLLEWTGPEDAFRAWQECSRGRPCDYTGLSYEKLRAGTGIQWPCNEEHPDGTVRLYTDGTFSTEPDYCETFGHDLLTGAQVAEQAFRALETHGRAVFKSADYVPPAEETTVDYPLQFTTGRTVYQFHTRTRTARARQLNRAAPSAWVEISPTVAAGLDIAEGDVVRVRSRRGELVTPARVSNVRDGTVFAPFHYGYWDSSGAGPGGLPTAANELTLTEWDPVSKQPLFKNAAVRLEKIADAAGPAPAPTTAASRPADPHAVPPTVGGADAEAQEHLGSVGGSTGRMLP
jgi:predicted molibdopterin-dependent oxidoreductase YjgC